RKGRLDVTHWVPPVESEEYLLHHEMASGRERSQATALDLRGRPTGQPAARGSQIHSRPSPQSSTRVPSFACRREAPRPSSASVPHGDGRKPVTQSRSADAIDSG